METRQLLWFGAATNLRQLPSARSISVNNVVVQPVTVVRDLGVWIDSELSMLHHVSRVAQTCFLHLRRLRSVRRQLGRDVSARLVSALVLPRLDYCNAVLAGLPAATLAPLQRVLNAAARLVLDLKPRDHAIPALRELHWLPMHRITHPVQAMSTRPQDIHQSVTRLHFRLAHTGRRHTNTLVSSSNNLFLPRTERRFGDRAFSVAAPRAWNRLYTELTLVRSSTTTFKRHLQKTLLFNSAYISH